MKVLVQDIISDPFAVDLSIYECEDSLENFALKYLGLDVFYPEEYEVEQTSDSITVISQTATDVLVVTKLNNIETRTLD